ncbi:unnamed protein product [Schistosoma curassoni]|uniref:Uncharacterized protein n=1 Tax=Schistosoma curassoni TaxID=6186 RepID=A0A183KCU7_9TREM|nr:unnamed protein product [Schistosoma curassoni]
MMNWIKHKEDNMMKICYHQHLLALLHLCHSQ